MFAGKAEDAAETIGPLAAAGRWARSAAAIEARHEGGRVLVAAGDDGPGMKPERAVRALRRGDGLGFAMAEDLARLAGGAPALGRSGGLDARLDLPAAPQAGRSQTAS